MTDATLQFAVGGVVWLAMIALIVGFQLKQSGSSVGLVIAYLAGLAIIHLPAALLYTLPGYFNNDPEVIRAGFVESVYAVIALAIGAQLIAPVVMHQFSNRRDIARSQPTQQNQLPRVYLLIGLLCYIVVVPLFGTIPTLGAMLSVGAQLTLVGLVLGAWQAWHQQKYLSFAGWLALALMLPLVTTLTQGFLGFGAFAALSTLIFAAMYVRPRRVVVPIGLAVAYIGLSVFVTYFRDRDLIRGAVWGGLPFDQRVQQISLTFNDFEWFDLNNPQHLQFVDGRLNQNLLVGAAVQFLEAGYAPYATGDTLIQSVLAIVPRAIWQDKPIFAGSPGLVSQYTGIQFAPGTSVGIGQVLEFYINFGTAGVVGGFLIFGTMLALIDHAAARALNGGNWPRLALWYLVGLGFLQSGGSMVEVVSTIGASFATAFLVNRYVVPLFLRGKAAVKESSRALTVVRR